MASIILFSLGLIFVYMSVWAAFAISFKRNDLADVAWGLGFIVLAWGLVIYTQNFSPLLLIAAGLTSIWGIRLAAHIGQRLLKKPEDERYQKMRDNWTYPKWNAYTRVFLLQGLIMILVSSPTLLLAANPQLELAWYHVLGIALWAVGFFFEAIGDWQLKKFIENPDKDGIMTEGLWRYTRHPNYFGEITQWWGIFVLTFFAPFWYLAALGPITISFFILGVSGIPMLEKKYEGNKEYEKYQKITSAFFPLPLKK